MELLVAFGRLAPVKNRFGFGLEGWKFIYKPLQQWHKGVDLQQLSLSGLNSLAALTTIQTHCEKHDLGLYLRYWDNAPPQVKRAIFLLHLEPVCMRKLTQSGQKLACV